jgi:isoleucyl-tRNA synthetase
VAPAKWADPALAGEFEQLFKARARVTEALEPLRQAGAIGKSLDAIVALASAGGDSARGALEKYEKFLPELFIVSEVSLQAQTGPEPVIIARHAKETGHTRCPRCWRWVQALKSTPHGEVCPRCEEALNS